MVPRCTLEMIGFAAVESQVEFARGLRGVWHRARAPRGRHRRPAVLLLHGFSGSRIEEGRLFVLLGRALAESGLHCLRFDFRGSGDSDGEFGDMTLSSEIADARAALKYMRRRPGVDGKRVGLLGLSLGSVVAQMIAASERVTALALWATIARPGEIFTWDLGAGARGYAAGTPFWLEIRQADPLAALASYRGPLLCVHGEKDSLPLSHPQAALQTVPGILHVVHGGDHTFGPYQQKLDAIDVTRRYFERCLLP